MISHRSNLVSKLSCSSLYCCPFSYKGTFGNVWKHFWLSQMRERCYWHWICLQCRRPRFDPFVGKIPWRSEWQPIPIFLPGKPRGPRSLAGYSPWGHKELDTTSLFYFYFYKKRGNIDFLQTGKLSKVWKRLLTCRAFCVFWIFNLVNVFNHVKVIPIQNNNKIL